MPTTFDPKNGRAPDLPFRLEFRDGEWPFTYTDHDRQIVRAIVVDGEGFYYFVRAHRDDEFGKAELIETSGGGVEPGEEFSAAIRRELREELGAEVEILCELGLVSDCYNLIHRHNLNHYYLCRVLSFGEKHLMPDEIEDFHLSTLKLRYEQAAAEYERLACTPLGRLIAQRELPVLRCARAVLEERFGAAGEKPEPTATTNGTQSGPAPADSEQLERIRRYEAMMNEAAQAVDAYEQALERFAAVREQLAALDDSCGSPAWWEDFQASEQGRLPKGLPCGVLSEDGIFDLLERSRELIAESRALPENFKD